MKSVISLQAPSIASRGVVEVSPIHTRFYTTLLIGFLFYTFVGTHPLADTSVGERVDGSGIDRLAVLGLFAMALFVVAHKWRVALAYLLSNSGQIFVVGFALLSALWSDFPDLTLRRALLLFFLTTIGLGLAVGASDLRRLHTVLFVFLTSVVILNLIAVAAVPARAITDIGVQGIYGQKNVAGMVAMIATVIGAAWILGAEDARSVRKGVLGLVPIIIFLFLTRSKTSINLTILGVFLMGFFAVAERYGPRFILLAVSLGLLALAALLIVFAAVDFDFNAGLSTVVADTSFTGRDQLWAFALNESHKRYWWGHGYGAFWDVGFANDPTLRVETGSWLATTGVGIINQAHNGYLELWLELGLPAAIVAALTTVKGAVSGGLYAISGADSRQNRAAIGAFAILLLLQILHNFTEATLFMRGMAYANVACLSLFVVARARRSSPSHSARMHP